MVVARKHMYKRQCTILLKHTSGSFEDGQIYQGNVMWHTGHCSPECDILVSKLLGFETSRFRNFSVSKLFHFFDGIGFEKF